LSAAPATCSISSAAASVSAPKRETLVTVPDVRLCAVDEAQHFCALWRRNLEIIKRGVEMAHKGLPVALVDA
jgi:hypothetical protein